MTHRPDQCFIVERISRASIACKLNRHLGRQEFAQDDERLSSRLCQSYATDFGWVSIHHNLYEVNEAMVRKLGISYPSLPRVFTSEY